MNRFSMEAKVGLFFIAAVLIFGYAWIYILGWGAEGHFILKAPFDSVEGLEKGAQVQIAGIKVGSVKGIAYDPETGKAVVTMALKDEYRGKIPVDSRVLLKTKGLVGDKYVAILPGKPNARKLKSGEEMTLVTEPVNTQKVMENMEIISQDLKVVTREIRKDLVEEKGGKKVNEVLTNSNEVFRDLRQLLAKNKARISSTIENAEGTVTKLNKLVGRNEKKIDRTVEDMNRFSRSMEKTSAKFDKVATDFEGVARDIRSGRGTLGKLVNEDTLYRDAQGLVREFRQLSDRVQNGPGVMGRLINDPELYYEARRAMRNMNKAAEDVSEATPVSTLAIILGSVFR